MEEKQRVANERANAFLRKRKEQEEAMAAAKVAAEAEAKEKALEDQRRFEEEKGLFSLSRVFE